MKARFIKDFLLEFERPGEKVDSRHSITKGLGIGQSQVRRIMPVEVTDEEIAETYRILEAGVDPNWDEARWGSMYIGITGKHRVYYTLWKWNPMSRTGIYYLGNAAMNIVDAAKKAKSVAGIQPVYLESSAALNSLKGTPPEVMTFGKFRGKTIGEVYATDPQYVIWLSKNMQPKNQKQVQQQQMAKELADDFFRSLGDKRRESEDKEFFGEVGTVFEGDIKVNQIKYFTNEYGNSIRLQGDGENNRFQFYMQNDIVYKFIEANDMGNVNDLKGKTIFIKGKVKGHKEILGHNYTFLNYVKLISVNES